MERADMISVNTFCIYYNVPDGFIDILSGAGLIEVTIIEEQRYLKQDQMKDIEKLVRLHTELEINPAGIEAIAHLLQRLDALQQELRALRQRLHLYEEPDMIQSHQTIILPE